MPDLSAGDFLEANRFRWSLEGFDGYGLAEVTLMTDRGELVARAVVHWSVIVRPSERTYGSGTSEPDER